MQYYTCHVFKGIVPCRLSISDTDNRNLADACTIIQLELENRGARGAYKHKGPLLFKSLSIYAKGGLVREVPARP